MTTKHLRGLIHYLLNLAGVPSQLPPQQPSGDDAVNADGDTEGILQPVRVKSFLHYL